VALGEKLPIPKSKLKEHRKEKRWRGVMMLSGISLKIGK
jgi:hypothetical protein